MHSSGKSNRRACGARSVSCKMRCTTESRLEAETRVQVRTYSSLQWADLHPPPLSWCTRTDLYRHEETHYPGGSFELKLNPSELELFREIPKSFSPKESEKDIESHSVWIGWKLIGIVLFQLERIRSKLLNRIWFGLSRILNPNQSNFEFIRIEPEWVGYVFNWFASNEIRNVFWNELEWIGLYSNLAESELFRVIPDSLSEPIRKTS